MSLKSEIAKSASYLRSTRRAIFGRGGEISATAGLKDLPEAIYKIPADASLAYRSDDSVAYRKIVPSGAEEYAQVAKVGGMTYKINVSKNLFKIDYIDDYMEISKQIDFSSLKLTIPNGMSGSVTVYPEEELFVNKNCRFYVPYLPEGVYCTLQLYVFDSFEAPPSSYTVEPGDAFRVDFTGVRVTAEMYIDFSSFEEDREFTLNIMIAEGDSMPTYEPNPYYELRDTKVTELVSEGANLIPFPYVSASQTYKGVTFTVNEDGSITCNRTAIEDGGFNLIRTSSGSPNVLFNGTYTLSGLTDGSSGTYYLQPYVDDSSKSIVTDSPRTYTLNGILTRLSFFFKTGAVFNNLTFYPMLNYGTTAAPYKPYRADAVDTFPISTELRAFLADKGYGRGVNADYYNYINFERKVFVHNTYRKVFDGTEYWQASNTTNGNVGGYRIHCKLIANEKPKFINATTKALMICNLYNTDTGENTYYCVDKSCACASDGLVYYDSAYNTSDISLWKAHLAELYASGNPLTVEYALAEPIEIDISAYLTDDNFIAVEGGGVIKAVNEYEYDAPSTINYIEKVG